MEGWGACQDGIEPSGSRWLAKEIAECGHINCLELKGTKLGLLSLCEKEEHVLIHLQSDVTTVITIIMGGTHSTTCNKAAQDIWLWCTEKKTWLKVMHIPRIQHETAERLRPNFLDRTEWQLQPSVFKLTTKKRERPDIDLFGSWHNDQIKPFVSWCADPDAYATDAMCLNWRDKHLQRLSLIHI